MQAVLCCSTVVALGGQECKRDRIATLKQLWEAGIQADPDLGTRVALAGQHAGL